MKKLILLLSVFVITATVSDAKDKKKKKEDKGATLQLNDNTNLNASTPGTGAATPASNLKPEDMDFNEMNHDFGEVLEGPDALCKFVITNKGKEPLVIQKAQASCGCTVPTYSKEPIAPGGTGTIDVAFHTQGKPAGQFNKSITITSNAGVKVLNIRGSVEKAPTTSAPENLSMMKIN